MADTMIFPKTVDEFMEQYKVVDIEKVYTNGTELVPIFRMKQWFEHSEKRGRWVIRSHKTMGECPCCSECGSFNPIEYRYCPNCGVKMDTEEGSQE